MFFSDHPFHRLSRFTVLSGTGWLLDTGTTLFLVWLGAAVFYSNMTGAALAVTFVYVTAQRNVFRLARGGSSRWGRFLAYVAYQIAAIVAASFLIAAVAFILLSVFESIDRTLAAAIAKVGVTPLTMYSNFLFMGWLIEGAVRWR